MVGYLVDFPDRKQLVDQASWEIAKHNRWSGEYGLIRGYSAGILCRKTHHQTRVRMDIPVGFPALGLERDSLEGSMNVMNHFGQGSELQSVIQAQTELEENLLGWLL